MAPATAPKPMCATAATASSWSSPGGSPATASTAFRAISSGGRVPVIPIRFAASIRALIATVATAPAVAPASRERSVFMLGRRARRVPATGDCP